MSNTTRQSTHSRTGPAQVARRGTALRRFTLHYFEMVVAMVVGMVVLGPLEILVLNAAGWPSVPNHAGADALLMATNMTVAMAGWMRFRGHTRAPIIEMSAAMYVPFLLLLVPLRQELITEDTFVLGGHALMLLGMLLAMLLRLEEYTGHHGATRDQRPPLAVSGRAARFR